MVQAAQAGLLCMVQVAQLILKSGAFVYAIMIVLPCMMQQHWQMHDTQLKIKQ